MSGVDAAIARVRGVYGKWRRDTPVAAMRADWDAMFADDVPDDAPRVAVSLNGVDGAWVTAPGSGAWGAILYLHGGGFRVGSTRSHHRIMADFSRVSGLRVLGIDYALAPEALHPAALTDVLTAWRWLRDEQGLGAHEIALVGDSAGGNLALLAMLRLRDEGAALPAAAVLLSAWTDLSAAGESFTTRADVDPIHDRRMILATAAGCLGGVDPRDPGVSPLFADLRGLPPMLLQVGDRETVLSDTTDFAATARAADVDARASVWPGMIHVFQQFPDLPEAGEALREAGDFLKSHLMENRP